MKAILDKPQTQKELYFDLVRRFPLKSIRTESEFKKAAKMVDNLSSRLSQLGKWEKEYLNILGDLIEAYEDKQHPIEDPEPYEILARLIENKDVSQRAAAIATGIPVSTISDLISRKRAFTLDHVRCLSAYFEVNPAAFI